MSDYSEMFTFPKTEHEALAKMLTNLHRQAVNKVRDAMENKTLVEVSYNNAILDLDHARLNLEAIEQHLNLNQIPFLKKV